MYSTFCARYTNVPNVFFHLTQPGLSLVRYRTQPKWQKLAMRASMTLSLIPLDSKSHYWHARNVVNVAMGFYVPGLVSRKANHALRQSRRGCHQDYHIWIPASVARSGRLARMGQASRARHSFCGLPPLASARNLWILTCGLTLHLRYGPLALHRYSKAQPHVELSTGRKLRVMKGWGLHADCGLTSLL